MESVYWSDKWKLLVPNTKTGIIEFKPEDVELKSGKEIILTPALLKHLDKVWKEKQEEALREGYVLNNGKLVRYVDHVAKNNKLSLKISETNYKEFIGTNVFLGEGGKLVIPPKQMSNPMGVLSSVLTTDDNTIVSLRSGNTVSYRNCYSLFGRGLYDCQELLKGETTIFDCVKNAVEEELKLSSNDIENPTLVGLNHIFLDLGGYGDYMFLFKTRVNKTAREVLKKKEEIIGNKRKYKNIELIPLNKGKYLKNFLNEKHYEFAGTGEPSLVLLGREEFGEEWVDGLNHVKKHNI